MTVPQIDTALLGDILIWAAEDYLTSEGRAHEFISKRHADWGTWNQGVWGDTKVDPSMFADGGLNSWGIQTNPQPKSFGPSGAPEENMCGSAFCMAGQAAVQDREYVMILSKNSRDDQTFAHFGSEYVIRLDALPEEFRSKARKRGWVLVPEYSSRIKDEDPTAEMQRVVHHAMSAYEGDGAQADGDAVLTVMRRARQMFGFTPHEAEVMFSGGNTVERVVSFGMAIAASRGQELDLPEHVTQFNQKVTARGYLYVTAYDGAERERLEQYFGDDLVSVGADDNNDEDDEDEFPF